MVFRLKFSLICALIIYFVCITGLLRKKRLSIRYSLLWFFAGIVMLIVVLTPDILIFLAEIIGIVDYSNGLYAVVFFLLIMLMMYLTFVVSELNYKNRRLVQTIAVLENRIRNLEKKDNEE